MDIGNRRLMGYSPVRSVAVSQKLHEEIHRRLNLQVNMFGHNPPDSKTTSFRTEGGYYEVFIHWDDTTHAGAVKVEAVTSDILLAEFFKNLRWVERVALPVVNSSNGIHTVTFFYLLPTKK